MNTLLVILQLFGANAFEVALHPAIADCTSISQDAHGVSPAQLCARDEVIARWVTDHGCEPLEQSVEDVMENGALFVCYNRRVR